MRKAVIMAGGFGTRLRPLTMSIPKPMVPLANRPMMGHIVELLKRHGIHDVVSVLYFQPEQITSYFEDGAAFGISMAYMTAEADYGTAGAVKNAQSMLSERFIIISGDVLTDFDISAAVAYHQAKGAMATILLTRVPQPLQYGIVMTDADGRITRFLEKPSWGEVFSDTINTGIYILEPEVLDLIPARTEFDFSKDLYPLMLQKGLPLYGYIADGYWKDVGNLSEYQLAHADVLAGRVNIAIPGERCDSSYCQPGLTLAPSAALEGMVVTGRNVTVGADARITNCVIGDDVVIGEGTVLSNTVVWPRTTIGSGATLSNDVVCNDVLIGSHVTVRDNVFIAEECHIGDHATLVANIKLWPRKHVEHHATLTRSLVQEERWSKDLFADARITGIANIDMNPEFGAKLGAALGMAVGTDLPLVASRDDDPVSRIMKRSITAGLMSIGASVSDLQTTSIPQTRQEMLTGRYAAGFHIRRSPRNPNETDIILFGKDGRDVPLSMTKSIERYYYGEDIRRVTHDKVGSLRFPERSVETYVHHVLSMVDGELIRNRNFKLLADYSHGLAAPVLPSILGELNCRVLSMNSYVDAAHFADPLPAVLDESAVIMRSLGYEIGIKIDPGAEKIAVVDERGIWYTSLRLLTIMTKLFLDTHRHMEPYTIAVPVQATMEIDAIVHGYNVKITRIRNSHGAMMEATKDETVAFVGGTRGGFIFPKFLFASDGMYTACQLLEMIAASGATLSELDRTLPKRYQSTVLVPCPWEHKGTVMRRAMEHSESMDRQLIDGVKIVFDARCVLLVPDKEGPNFAVTAEADTAEEALSLRDDYAQLVTAWQIDG
jgi:mannose-1-phosphate guanylyltransferase/phosphomannomutase